ncbi:ABC-2 transporter permease [Paenibacillus puldeungensis]|uniref:ABC-2 transporter permease n=1 Tax=Paenibacillus puldeungensis TaxID=696536 RepID=A0ABW3RY83_9BACL
MHNLVHLVRKDLMLMQRYLWLIAIYAVVFSSFVQSGNSPLYGMLPGMVLILILNTDIRLPNQHFLVSLPVRRRFLVMSKYVSCLIGIVAALFCCLLLNAGADAMYGRPIHWDWSLTFTLLLAQVLFMSLYIPFYYWLGLKGAQYMNVAMIVVLMVGSQVVSELLGGEDAIKLLTTVGQHPYAAGLLGVSVTLLVMVISYFISRAIFTRRNL